MTSWVVDASVAAKWFFPEEDSTLAAKLLSKRRTLLAPDLLWSEFANLVWKRSRQGELSRDEASEIVADFLAMPIEFVAAGALIPAALELAILTGRTVYDCLYLALALDRSCRLVTADQRMVNALAASSLKKQIVHVSEVR